MKCIVLKIIDNIKFIQKEHININNSITNHVSLKENGIEKYHITLIDNSKKNIIIKHKNKNILLNGINLLSKGNMLIKFLLLMNNKVFNYSNSYKREIVVYENIDNSLKNNLINYYGSYHKGNDYYLVLDYYESSRKFNYQSILDAIIKFHVFYYNDQSIISKMMLNNNLPHDYLKCKRVMKLMFNSLNNKIFGKKFTNNINKYIDNIDINWEKYLFHRTLTHNDFSLRNMFINENVQIYDWELCAFQNPEHDLIEFMIYELDEIKEENITKVINYYKDNFYSKINIKIDDDLIHEILVFNIYEFIVNRLTLLRLSKTSIIDVNKLINNIKMLLKNIGDIEYE